MNVLDGYATIEGQGQLNVVFPSVPSFFMGPNYIVTNIWDNYEQALVTGPFGLYFWVLSRNKTIPEPRLIEILDFANAKGYNASSMGWKLTEQLNCTNFN